MEAKTKRTNKTAKPALSVENVLDAVGKNKGNIAGAAKSLNCDRTAIYRIISKHPDLKDLIEKIREDILDEAEISLLERIKEGNITSIIFALKTLGKSRGYSSSGENKHKKMESISESALKKLTDEQLAHLEKLIKKGKDPGDFLIKAGIDVTAD
jgi:hypothetical protein